MENDVERASRQTWEQDNNFGLASLRRCCNCWYHKEDKEDRPYCTIMVAEVGMADALLTNMNETICERHLWEDE